MSSPDPKREFFTCAVAFLILLLVLLLVVYVATEPVLH